MTPPRKDREVSKFTKTSRGWERRRLPATTNTCAGPASEVCSQRKFSGYWLVLIIIDSMTRSCRHPRVGRACLATQECGGKGGICFELGWSLLRVLQWCFFSRLAQSGMVFRAGAHGEDLPRGGVSTNLCVSMSCEACKHFLLAIKTRKCTNELNIVF